MDQETLARLLDMIEKESVAVDRIIGVLMEKAATVCDKLHDLYLSQVPNKRRLFDAYINEGFTREEAMTLLVSSEIAALRVADRAKGK